MKTVTLVLILVYAAALVWSAPNYHSGCYYGGKWYHRGAYVTVHCYKYGYQTKRCKLDIYKGYGWYPKECPGDYNGDHHDDGYHGDDGDHGHHDNYPYPYRHGYNYGNTYQFLRNYYIYKLLLGHLN